MICAVKRISKALSGTMSDVPVLLTSQTDVNSVSLCSNKITGLDNSSFTLIKLLLSAKVKHAKPKQLVF